jgi:Sulfotransferase family
MSIAESPLRDRVIFVQGAPRSGTTWLVTLLALHPEIAGVEAESHLFEYGVDHLFDNYEGRHPLFRGLHSYVEDRQQLVDLVRDLCDGVLLAMRDHVSGGAASRFVVEKTPSTAEEGAPHLLRKREVFPDAWYLHIVRDREDVVRSLMNAPWMPDRSRAECTRVWEQSVAKTREAFGDSDRYREISYEELRADPEQGAGELFRWLGVDAGELALQTVRAMSRERYSERAALAPAGSESTRQRARRIARRVATAARVRIQRAPASDGRGDPGYELAFRLVAALRARDRVALVQLTTDAFTLEYRSDEGDEQATGEEARGLLVSLARRLFDRRHVSEWWVAPPAGPSEWWTAVGNRPVSAIFFSALGGDASRVDVALAVFLDGERAGRIVVISAGPLSGRPLHRLDDPQASGKGEGPFDAR